MVLSLDIERILTTQQRAFAADGIPDAATRIDRVVRLKALLLDNADELADALRQDYGSRHENLSIMADIVGCMSDLDHHRTHLRRWMRTDRPSRVLGAIGVRNGVRHDPKGVVGIIGPWNFPLQLTIVPAGAALAAGNRVMMRPSSVTAVTAATLARLAPRYFDEAELAVTTREQSTGSEFSKLAFDHIFFTGSPEVGAEVAKDAAAQLVPVTLELGGKNPVVVDEGTDVVTAAERVADARMLNGGQVCLCPDYVFVPQDRLDTFVDSVVARWKHRYPTIATNPDFTSTVDTKNFDRICALITDAEKLGATAHRAVPAGEEPTNPATRKIVPTVLTGVTSDMEIESVEVFGPVLTVYPYRRLAEAIDFVNAHPHPLSIYWFGDDNERYRRLQDWTRSGSINGNDVTMNMISGKLPFGGVGRSGMGNYHGKYGFDTFSHARAVTHSSLPVSIAQVSSTLFSEQGKRSVAAQLAMHRVRTRFQRTRSARALAHSPSSRSNEQS